MTKPQDSSITIKSKIKVKAKGAAMPSAQQLPRLLHRMVGGEAKPDRKKVRFNG